MELLPVSLSSFIQDGPRSTVWWTSAFFITIIPVVLLCLRHKRRMDMLWKIPGSPGNPFLVAVAIVSSIMNNKIASMNVVAFEAICGFTKIFDQERLYRFWFGLRPVIMFYKPETVEVVLSSNTIIDKTFVYDFLHLWFKAGLITSTGIKWKKRRKLLTPAFHFRILEDFLPVINEQSTILIENLRKESTQGSFDMVKYITLCSLDILCETAMGKKVNSQLETDSPYLAALRQASEMFASRFIRPWLWPDSIFYLSPGGIQFRKCMQEMGDFTRNVIRERKVDLQRRMLA